MTRNLEGLQVDVPGLMLIVATLIMAYASGPGAVQSMAAIGIVVVVLGVVVSAVATRERDGGLLSREFARLALRAFGYLAVLAMLYAGSTIGARAALAVGVFAIFVIALGTGVVLLAGVTDLEFRNPDEDGEEA